MRVVVFKHEGRYNLCDPKEVEEMAGLAVDNQRVGYTWDVGDCPFDEDTPPSDVIPYLREKMAKLWINTGRERETALLDKWEADAAQLDHHWAATRIEICDKRIAELNKQIKRFSHYLISEDDSPPTCILTGAAGENPEDCTTHDHEE